MSGVAAAIAASAVVGGVASNAAANKASSAMKKSSNNQLALEREMFDYQRQTSAPYQQVGGAGLNAYARAMGLPQFDQAGTKRKEEEYQYTPGPMNAYGIKRAFREFMGREPTKKEWNHFKKKKNSEELYYDIIQPGQQRLLAQQQQQQPQQQVDDDPYGGFMASPGYQFRRDQGAQGLDRNMAARGLLNSGARGKAMTEYNQNVASDEFGNYMNRLAGVAGIGQTATNNMNQMAGGFAQGAGNAMQNSGMARASGYLATGNAISSGLNNFAGSLAFRNRAPAAPGYASQPPTGYT
jgi:outer membrane murein-binding lipoprotein Lpp